MKVYFSLLLLLISSSSFSQNNIDLEKLRLKVYRLVNEERVRNDRKILGLDELLQKPANDQATYIEKIKALSHEQSNPKKRKLKDRMLWYCGTTFTVFAENLLFTSIIDKVYSDEDLDVLALKMVTLWKNSPNHYKNMLDHEFFYTEFGFSIDWKNSKVYAVQLFGA